MDVNVLRLDPEVAEHLQGPALAAVARRLHPGGDCVVCHRTLGQGPVSVSLILGGDEFDLTHVLPAHAACQPSTLRRVNGLEVGAPIPSHRTLTLLLPNLGPILLINEQVDVLTGGLRDGRWTDMRLLPVPDDSDLGQLNGLVKLDPRHRPLPPDSARWGARLDRHGELTVTSPFSPYTAPATGEVGTAIKRAGKLLVLVTDEVRIDDLLAADSPAALYAAVHEGHVHGAWAVLGADPADVPFPDRAGGDRLTSMAHGAAGLPRGQGTTGIPVTATPLTSTAQYQEIENDVTVHVRAGFSDHRALRLTPPGAPRYPVLLLEPARVIGLSKPGHPTRDLRVENAINNGLHRMPPAPDLSAVNSSAAQHEPGLLEAEDLLNPARDWVVKVSGGRFRAARVQLYAPFDQLIAEGDLRYPPGWKGAAEAAGAVLVLYGPMIGVRSPRRGSYNDDDRHQELRTHRDAGMVAWARVVWGSGRDVVDQEPAADGSAARVQRDVDELLDPDRERSMVLDGDRGVVLPGQVLQNLRERMERMDRDPDTTWSPEELMPYEEVAVMFAQLSLGDLVVAQTAWYARQVLTRWPLELVEHPIAPEARLSMFLIDPVTLSEHHQDLGRRVLNRALASPTEVESHPELQDLDTKDLMNVWLAVVFWFGIKSGSLNQRARGQGPTP